MSDDLVGVTIAEKYLVKRRIGEGGMGAVYEAEHVAIGKRVAVKVIAQEHAWSAELAARFRREARAASAVESEHIVQVFDVGQDPDIGLFMVMEYLVGEDLASRIAAAGGKLPVEEAAGLVVQTARALARAHAAGVVHRDLKPANLFLTTREDGSTCVKVLDFGISKLVRDETEETRGKSSLVTREGAVMGTPMYMSPEQAQGLKVDARTDLWSLGAVLYEALAGRTLFEERDTYEQMIVQIVTTRPTPLAAIAPWVPEPIARVVDKAVVHDRQSRIADAATFARELAEAARLPSLPSSSPVIASAVVRGPNDAVDVATAPTVHAVAIAHTPALPPMTSPGLVRAVPTATEARPRRGLVLGIGALVVGGVAIAAVVATRKPTARPISASGEGSSTSSATAATATAGPSASGAVAPSALEAPPPPSASIATTSTSVATRPSASAPTTRPTSRPPTPTTNSTSGKPGQYGGAGVETKY